MTNRNRWPLQFSNSPDHATSIKVDIGDEGSVERPPTIVTLGALVEQFVRAPSYYSPLMRRLQNLFYLFRLGSPRSSEKEPAFVKILAPYHKHVLALLEEWWTGHDGDEAMPIIKGCLFRGALAFAQNDLYDEELARLEELTPVSDLEHLRQALQSLEAKDGRIHEVATYYSALADAISWQRKYEVGMGRSYHQSLYKLFFFELGLSSAVSVNAEFVIFCRTDASIRATAARISRICLEHVQACTRDEACLSRWPPSSDTNIRLGDFDQSIPVTVEPCYWLREE